MTKAHEMVEDLRPTGINVIGDVPWGTHFCQFYETKEDLLDILVPYFKAGLEHNEFCMWVTSASLTDKEALQAMTKAMPDFAYYLGKGQIEVVPYDQWYLKDSVFNQERVLNGWVDKLNQALARGYVGLRLTGDTIWLERNHWQSFTEYEAVVNSVIGSYHMVAICTYSLGKCGASEVIDVVANHQFAIIKRRNKWEIIESAERKQTEAKLRRTLRELQQHQKEISALLQASRAVLEHATFEAAAREIFDSCKNLLGASAGYVVLLNKDGTQYDVLFLDAGRLPCTVDPSLPMPIRGLRAEVYRTGTAAYNNDFSTTEWMKLLPQGHIPLDNVLFASLLIEGKPVGLLGLANKPGGFTENDARLAMAVGELAAVSLRNSRTSELLQNSEERFRSVVQTGNDAIIAATGSGNIIFWNRAAETILGYSAGEVLGKPLTMIIPEGFRERHEAAMTKAISTGETDIIGKSFEVEGVRKDGSRFPAELSIGIGRMKEGIFFTGILRDISERKQTEAALKRSEEQYRSIVETANEGIWLTDAAGRTVLVNERMAQMLGYTVPEMAGKPFFSFVSSPDHARALSGHETHQKGVKEHYEIKLNRKDGSELWAVVSGSPIFDSEGRFAGSLDMFADITERRRAELALQESEANYRTLVESSPDVILSLDARRRIINCNQGVYQLLGYTTEEIQSMDIRRLVASTVPKELLTQYARLIRNKHLEGEFQVVSRNGKTIPVWAKAVALFDNRRRFTRAVVYIRDITERKKLDEMKDEFIGLVSHEIRTPLTVIMGAIDTVVSEKSRLPPEEIDQLLEDAALETESLSYLVENLLELSRSRADRLSLDIEPVDIAAISKDLVKKMKPQSPAHHFVLSFPKNFPTVQADSVRVERILRNLLENAVKYSPEGGKIRIMGKQEIDHPDSVVIGVSDQGIGIPLHAQSKLFRPFERLESYGFNEAKGVGLGLLVCRRLVEAHGGRIWVESQPGHGATFFFTLPLKPPSN